MTLRFFGLSLLSHLIWSHMNHDSTIMIHDRCYIFSGVSRTQQSPFFALLFIVLSLTCLWTPFQIACPVHSMFIAESTHDIVVCRLEADLFLACPRRADINSFTRLLRLLSLGRELFKRSFFDYDWTHLKLTGGSIETMSCLVVVKLRAKSFPRIRDTFNVLMMC